MPSLTEVNGVLVGSTEQIEDRLRSLVRQLGAFRIGPGISCCIESDEGSGRHHGLGKMEVERKFAHVIVESAQAGMKPMGESGRYCFQRLRSAIQEPIATGSTATGARWGRDGDSLVHHSSEETGFPISGMA